MRKINLADYNFELPEELIAKEPVRPRDHSRLLVLDRKSGEIEHRIFYEIIDFLEPGDVLVMNDSKVFPARLLGEKQTGGKVEILLDKQIDDASFEAIGKHLKTGDVITFPRSRIKCYIISLENRIYKIRFSIGGEKLIKEIDKIGQTPLPPYILKARGTEHFDQKEDQKDYQTVYAKERGSAAAPTAGLHFTKSLLQKIKDKGVEIEKVTLHVGLGTFAPVKSDDISEHRIHQEYYSVQLAVWDKIVEAKKSGRRIIAVGTTTTRVLETLAGRAEELTSLPKGDTPSEGCPAVQLISGWTNIFITPGYEFKCVDALITNFHIPKSTLLLLVSAFASDNLIKKAYHEAIKHNYRFYSFGDAMLIV
jgi:S-adenosylmethionine:tRNA ribosyltransferase-isomerase